MQVHATAWEQEGCVKEEQKQNLKGLYQQSHMWFAYATCVGRASYGRLEAIFILYQSVTERCPSGMSVNCQRKKKEENQAPVLIKCKSLPLRLFSQSTSQLQGQRHHEGKCLLSHAGPTKGHEQ